MSTVLPKKLTTKAQIAAFLAEHPTWVLQWCEGTRFYSWWWLRESVSRGDVVMCHAGAAQSVAKGMRHLPSRRAYGERTYALAATQNPKETR